MSYDALVVGSGPNGLAAGITLARAGRRVLVLEAADRAGGAVATEELTLPGFHHDTFSSVYPAGAASPVFASMPLQDHGLRWVHPPVCLAHPLPDGRAVGLYRDLDRTAASLDAIHPGDGGRWRAFADPFLAHFQALRATMLGGFPPIAGSLRLAAGLGPRGILEFAGLLGMPARKLGERLFEDEGSRAWLYGSAMHSDMPPAAGERDRGGVPEHPRSRRGVAQPGGRRGQAGRGADLLPVEPRRGGAHRGEGHARGGRARPRGGR